MRRILLLGTLSLAGTGAVFLILLIPSIEWVLPDVIRQRRMVSVLGVLAVTHAMGRVLVRRSRSRGIAARLLDRADDLAGFALTGWLSIVVAGICCAYLATWLPHYILWPWARDADTFATLAQSWDAGIRPYRDIHGYNFPGAIYLFWLLGKTAGWGRTWALYVVDAAGLMLLGITLAAWSRRCLDRAFPGLASYFLFLTFYLHLDFMIVAQRDWHASLCIVLGLLTLQGWPGRAARVGSAFLAAAALSIRPHAILFLPALASAVLEGTDRQDPGSPSAVAAKWRRLAGWLLMLSGFTALAFSPLLIAGIAADLLRGLRVAAYGGPYSRASLASMRGVLAAEVFETETLFAVVLMALLLVATRGAARRRAITWLLAMAAALIYRMVHPIQHRYLAFPPALFGSVSLALPIGWILDQRGLSLFPRVVAVLMIIGEVGLGIPRFCNPAATGRALVSLARGQTIPVYSPPGAGTWFNPEAARRYLWDDYRATLIYLRESTSPETPVANVLREPPYPSINGPAGRVSPFRAESGICWMLHVAVDLEPEFTAALERTTDAVVVWCPGDEGRPSLLPLAHVTAAIHRHYRPEARFGKIEVWRRAGPRRSDPARAGIIDGAPR